MKAIRRSIGGLGLLLLAGGWAQAQQCVSTAAAGGTANAIVIPQLPCAAASTLALVTAASSNSGAVTLQQIGSLASPVLKGTGIPLIAGDIPGAGFVMLLSNNGTSWTMLNPAGTTAGSPGGATGAVQVNGGAGTFGGTSVVGNATLVTDPAGVASENQTLPGAVQSNITQLGNVTSGSWLAGTIGVSKGGTGLTGGTAGGLMVFSAPGTLVSTSALTSGLPLIAGGTGLPTTGTLSGNTTKLASVSGALTAGDLVISDGSGNLVDGGVPGTTSSTMGSGRLTLSAGVPVLTGAVTSAASVLLTPYNGDTLPIYDGVKFVLYSFTELSNVLANSSVGMAGPAVAVAASGYDLFVWRNSGAMTLTRGPAWTNSTSRSAGTALVRVGGVLLNNTGIANGPGAQRGTYVGSIFTDAGGATVSYSPGGSASGGTAGTVGLWNVNNRVQQAFTSIDTGAGYSYSSGTIRQARASVGNQVTMFRGLAEDGIQANYTTSEVTGATGGAFTRTSIALDSTTAFQIAPSLCETPVNANYSCGINVATGWTPGLGQHYVAALESGDGSTADNLDADSLNALSVLVKW